MSLIPMGNIEFNGDLEALLHTIARADGVLKREREFDSTLSFPQEETRPVAFRFFSVRGRVRFTFQCRYEQTASGFLITYRVVPAFSSIFLGALPFLAMIYGLMHLTEQEQGYLGLLGGGIAAIFCYPYLLWARKSCVRRFERIFLEK